MSVSVMPMFPLGSVLVPDMVLPLHVFEPRYRQLVHDCLHGDQRFGVVLIERGSEVGGGEVRTDVGTVATIIEAAGSDDGRWALGCIGTERVRVRRWLEDDPYPRADVEPWPDPPPARDLTDDTAAVVARLRRVLALTAEMGRSAPPATTALGDDPVRTAYHVAALAPLGPSDLQRLLVAPDPAARLELLATMLVDLEDVLDAELALAAEAGEPFD